MTQLRLPIASNEILLPSFYHTPTSSCIINPHTDQTIDDARVLMNFSHLSKTLTLAAFCTKPSHMNCWETLKVQIIPCAFHEELCCPHSFLASPLFSHTNLGEENRCFYLENVEWLSMLSFGSLWWLTSPDGLLGDEPLRMHVRDFLDKVMDVRRPDLPVGRNILWVWIALASFACFLLSGVQWPTAPSSCCTATVASLTLSPLSGFCWDISW